MTVTNQNCICKEIKTRLKSWNACCHSVQNILSSHLLSENIKTKIYKSVILPIVSCECGTWLPAQSVEHRLKVPENGMLRIFGPKRKEVTRGWRTLHNEGLHNLYLLPGLVE
jgi:hypothetical protein